jgi:hypothetical protein
MHTAIDQMSTAAHSPRDFTDGALPIGEFFNLAMQIVNYPLLGEYGGWIVRPNDPLAPLFPR